MNTRVKNKIIELAKASPNEEICGFIYYNLTTCDVFPCLNQAINKESNFEISGNDYLECLKIGKIWGIYHSHPKTSSAFSEADKETSEEICLPLYLYSLIDEKFADYIPSDYELPLECAPFIWGLRDCYEEVRIFFRQKFDIHLTDFDRDEDFSSKETTIVFDNIDKENFIKVDKSDIKYGDVIVFRMNLGHPKHLGVFIGDSRMIHHPQNGLSGVELLNEFWLKRINCILRHKQIK